MALRLAASGFVTRWIAATLALSIVAALDGGWLAGWASLVPSKVWHGQIWRLVTWPLVESGPTSLVLACAAIYKLGGDLAARWGDRRLRRFVLEVLGAAGIATCILTAVSSGRVDRLGGWAAVDTLVIAWARQFPERTLVVYGMLRLGGRELVAITVAVAILYAIYFGPMTMAPELAAVLAAAAYPRGLLRR
jgi:membrane associated rhomboid family serine protease